MILISTNTNKKQTKNERKYGKSHFKFFVLFFKFERCIVQIRIYERKISQRWNYIQYNTKYNYLKLINFIRAKSLIAAQLFPHIVFWGTPAIFYL